MNFEFIDLSLDDRQFKGETHNKNLEDAMKQAIVNFCKSMDTGLFLLDMPTGFGKTYSVLDFMVDNYDAPEFKDKKIFFVTTLKKNLPDKELREHFARRGKADDYDKYCLRIEANADMVVQKLDELYRARKIPPTITMKQEFKDLHGSVKLLNEYRDKKRELKGTSKDIINVLCKSAEDAIRKQQEGAFRKVIESELKQFRTPKEKLKNIANNPDYHWIGELYPAVYTREVSRKDGIAVIKDAFICFSGGYTFSGKKGEPYKTDSVNNYALRTLIQAVGRICRTGLKNPDIYIYVDNTFLTDYDLSIVEQRMLNPEFAELVKVGKIYYNGQANENLDRESAY